MCSSPAAAELAPSRLGGVKAHPPGGRVVEVDEARNLYARGPRPVQRQSAVLAARPQQGMPATHFR